MKDGSVSALPLGCESFSRLRRQKSGFLDYSLLGKGGEGKALYVYRNPKANWSGYEIVSSDRKAAELCCRPPSCYAGCHSRQPSMCDQPRGFSPAQLDSGSDKCAGSNPRFKPKDPYDAVTDTELLTGRPSPVTGRPPSNIARSRFSCLEYDRLCLKNSAITGQGDLLTLQ